ncbi:MAG: methylated-DNA--[protein]-cysteine S-methyltransferase [Sphingobacteriales bacterium]|nr:methylated-DNA--[protein]-cysteine S-methyltransferase [Sphingobacteriales bacterium]
MNSIFISYVESPIGMIEIKADEQSILSVQFKDTNKVETSFSENEISKNGKQQLSEYFASERKEFELPLKLSGTDFQNKVWTELQVIPYSKTISYLQLAKNLGDPKCIRAAGTANGKNPFAIVVPCHRVIGSNGDLIGYAGGLWRKQWLLEHEHNLQKQVSLF